MTDGTEPAPEPLTRLLEIMRALRAENGCPWDRKQTLASLRPFLIEESYELIEAIDRGDYDAVREELGDVLLQVVFQAQVCAEAGRFDFQDVARGIADKLVRRHPHVFGDVKVSGADEVLRNWDAIKRGEKQTEESPRAFKSVIDGLPRALPGLLQADQAQKRAARVGFDWDQPGPALDKIEEEVRELRAAMAAGRAAEVRGELGDLLFSLVNLARHLQVNPEDALRATTAKFIRRFRHVEQQVHASGRPFADFTLGELDAFWNEAKAGEAKP